ncbi:MAG: DUF456 domain-containing protein [Bacteroidales bacterium]|nr:DUF456 domain-containing protein [Bacteroidales bacterium]
MDTLLIVGAIALGILGIVGSIMPGLPGPPLGWLGLLLAYIAGGTNGNGQVMTTAFLGIWLGVTTLVTILDYVVPGMFTKLTGGSKYAGRGAIIGLFAGMFIPPVGIILGSLLGAFLAEILFAGKDPVSSVSSAFGAFIGFLFGTGIKIITSGLMLYYIIVYI